MTTILTVKQMIFELSRQHACDGHIDLRLAEQLTSHIDQCKEIDLKLLREAIALQSHVISDMAADCSPSRLREVTEIQAVICALIGQ